MTKPVAFLALLAALVVPTAAIAQNNVALRSGPGVQFTCSASAPTHVATRGMFWCNSADGNRLYYTDPSGTSSRVGLGTLVSLANSYLNGSSQADTTIQLDSTRGFVKYLDAASTLGTLFQIRNSTDTNSWISFTSNGQNFIKGGMADGASAIGLAVDTNSSWANATSKILRVLTGGSERFSVTGQGNVNLVSNATINAPTQLNLSDGTGILSLLSGAISAAVSSISPDVDGTRSVGTSSKRWGGVFAKVYYTTEQSVAFSVTPTFNCNNGGQIHFGDVTANVTSITMTDGTVGGQECRIIIRKDGTGTSWTIPGNGNWTTHVRTMAAAQGIGTSANAFLVFDYVWDAQLGTPSWVMTHAPGNPL